jgi:hypothetical protein
MRTNIACISILLGTTLSASATENLTFEDRVAAQTAIERVYWRHRIWPSENPGPKPSLDAVLPAAASSRSSTA